MKGTVRGRDSPVCLASALENPTLADVRSQKGQEKKVMVNLPFPPSQACLCPFPRKRDVDP
jgi:hypothetical protein